MRHVYLWVVAAVASTGLSSCGGGESDGGKSKRIDPAASMVGASPPQAVANGSARISVEVRLRAQGTGAGIDGVLVTLEASGTGNEVSEAVVTGADGLATFHVSSTVAEQKTLTATAGVGSAAVVLDETPTVLFVPGPPATTSTLTPTPASAPADGVTPIDLVLVARDQDDNLIAGAPVSFTANGGDHSFTVIEAVTDAAGVATTSLTSLRSGPKLVTAELGGRDVSAMVTFTAGAPRADASVMMLQPQVPVTGQTATLTLHVRDLGGTGVSGQSVSWAVDDPDTTLVPASGQTDAQGVLTATLTSTVAGAKLVTATVGGAVINQGFTVAAGPASEALSTLVLAPDSVSADSPSAGITVTLRDAYGNPAPSRAVSFSSPGDALDFAAASGTSDGLGLVVTSAATSTAGTYTVQAHVDGITLEAPLEVSAGLPSGLTSSLSTLDPDAVADGVEAVSLTLILLDAHQNPIEGALCDVEVSGEDSTYPATVLTGPGGVATFTVRSTTAGQRTVSASIGDAAVYAEVELLAGDPDLDATSIDFGDSPLGAGESTTVTVTVRDFFENPVPGASVLLEHTGAGLLTGGSGDTNDDGELVASFTTTAMGTRTFTATVGLVVKQRQLEVRAGPADAGTSTLVANDGTVATADDVETLSFTATFQDVFGNPLADQDFVIEVGGELNTVVPGGETLDGNGAVDFSIRSQRAQDKEVSVTAGGLTLALASPVSFEPGLPFEDACDFEALPSPISADGEQAVVTLVVRDEFDNPVPGVAVVFAASGEDPDFSDTDGVTGADGALSVDYGSNVAEDKTLSASFSGLTLYADVTVVPGEPAALYSELTGDATHTRADGADTLGLTLTVRDVNQNPVPGVSAEWDVTGALPVLDVEPGETDEAGELTATLSSIKIGTKLVSVQVNGDFLEQLSAPFVAGPPDAGTSTLVINPDVLPAGDGDRADVDLVVRDGQGNVVEDAQVTLTAQLPGVDFSVDSGETTVDGIFGSELESTVVGENVVYATITTSLGEIELEAPVSFTYAPPHFTQMGVLGGLWRGCIEIEYHVRQAQGLPVDVTLEYLDGSEYRPATQAGCGPEGGLQRESGVASGVRHTLFWNSAADIGRVRAGVTMRLAGRAGDAGVAYGGLGGVSVYNELTFVQANTVGTSSAPRALVFGDLNRDGWLDLVRGDVDGGGTIRAQLGNGNGTFGAALPAHTSLGRQAVLADLDRDGKLDLVTTGLDAAVDVSLGNGDGSFQPRQQLLAASASYAVVEDFDLDGVLDIAASDQALGMLRVFFGHGDGGFEPSADWTVLAPYASWLAVGDFDRDGDPDLAAAHIDYAQIYAGEDVRVMLNDGSGGFPAAVSYPVFDDATSARYVVAGDLDRDGDLDLAAGSGDVFLGHGDGSFEAASHTGVEGRGAALGDVDGDGVLELAVTGVLDEWPTPVGRIYADLYRADGSGGFALVTSQLGWDLVHGVALADVDGNGQLDLGMVVAGASSTQVQVNTHAASTRCDPGFAHWPELVGSYQPSKLGAGDMNGDGRLDLVPIGIYRVGMALGTGNGFRFEAPPGYPVDGYSAFSTNLGPVVADFSQDGKLDVLIGDNLGGVGVRLGTGSGTLGASEIYTDYAGDDPITVVVAGHFDADANLDLVSPSIGKLYFARGAAGGSFDAGLPSDLLDADDWGEAMVAGAFDADACLDVVLAGTSLPETQLLRGNCDGTFDAPSTFPVGPATTALAAADLDRDGDLDLVAGNYATNHLTVALGDGSGGFSPTPAEGYTLAGQPRNLAIGDFDGDGWLDIAASSFFEGTVHVLRGTGGGLLAAPKVLEAQSAPVGMLAADLDGDGRDELGVAESGAYSYTIFSSRLGMLDAAPAGARFRAAPPAPSGLAAGDFDRDGKPDLVTTASTAIAGAADFVFFEGLGDGGFAAGAGSVVNAGGGAAWRLLPGDLDRDGKLDLLAHQGSRVLSVTGTGAGGFAAAGGLDIAPQTIVDLAAADLDRDGVLDVVLAQTGLDTVLVALGAGDGSFGTPTPYAASSIASDDVTSVAVADVDRDGDLDLVLALARVGGGSTLALLNVLRNDGAGVFGSLYSGPPIGGGEYELALADMDKNGSPDVFAMAKTTGWSSTLLNNGAGFFAIFESGYSDGLHMGADVVLRDLDNDGDVDMASASSYGNELLVRSGKGNGQLEKSQHYGVGSFVSTPVPEGLVAADFDRDGRPDLAVLDHAGGRIGVLLGAD